MTAARPLFVLAALLVLTLACGKDYTPPMLETTGEPAALLDREFDLVVTLPGLFLRGDALVREEPGRERGAVLEVHVSIAGDGYGELPAIFEFGPAQANGQTLPVTNMRPGRETIVLTPEVWLAGPIGPLVIEGVAFELVLDGDMLENGWRVEGRAFETQTGREGSFVGWRRHRFLVAGTDLFSQAASIAEVALLRGGEAIEVRTGLELVSSDPVLRLSGGAIFAINRFSFDNLQRLDPTLDFRTTWQESVGSGANPQDVLVLSPERAYASRYEPPFDDLAVFDPDSGALVGSIDLVPLADNVDGTPRPTRLVSAEGVVFAALQDIDRSFTQFSEGKLAVIDPVFDVVIGQIPLGGKNPWDIEVVRGADARTHLYVSLGGIFAGLQGQELSGGVVVVDAFDRVFERVALDDDVAGGNIAALAMAGDRVGYAVVSDASFTNRVLAFDPAGAGVLRTVWQSFDFIPEIDLDTGGVLAIPDRSFFEPRLCFYRVPARPEDPELALGCASLPLPPFSVEALD